MESACVGSMERLGTSSLEFRNEGAKKTVILNRDRVARLLTKEKPCSLREDGTPLYTIGQVRGAVEDDLCDLTPVEMDAVMEAIRGKLFSEGPNGIFWGRFAQMGMSAYRVVPEEGSK